MSRVLVTGGAGYIGSFATQAILRAGHEVIVYDDLSQGHRQAVEHLAIAHRESHPAGGAAVTLIEGDIRDADKVRDALVHHRVQAVMHFAARLSVGESVHHPSRYYDTNVRGTLTVLEAMRAASVPHFVFSSTAAVFGEPLRTPIDEDHPKQPINAYGETKRTVEGALRFFGEAFGLRSVSLRYFNVAGATEANGELHDPETHLIPNVLRAAETGQPITLFGDDYPTPDGTCVRDYLHVADLADAHLLALEATAPDDARTDRALVCNLGTGTGFSVRQVVDAASAVVGRRIPETMGGRRAGDPPVLVAAGERARDVLGWVAARPDLETMIGSAWEWRRRNLDVVTGQRKAAEPA